MFHNIIQTLVGIWTQSLDRLDVYYCEEKGLKQIKVQLLTGVFYIAICGIRWPVCSIHSQDFVKCHAFTTGKTAV